MALLSTPEVSFSTVNLSLVVPLVWDKLALVAIGPASVTTVFANNVLLIRISLLPPIIKWPVVVSIPGLVVANSLISYFIVGKGLGPT